MNLKINDLKKYLKDKKQEDLIKEIVDLTKQFPDVKEYYSVKINPESEIEVYEKYQKIIGNEFFPDRGNPKMGYAVVNKAIRDFKKLTHNVDLITELLLFYVKVGIEFTNTYGDIDERFYLTIEKAYDNALDYIYKNDRLEQFADKAREITEAIGDMGWGFNEGMMQIYWDYYDDEDEF